MESKMDEINTARIGGLRIALTTIEASIASFDSDPADTDYQKGYLASLREMREEIERSITRMGGGH